VVDRNKVYVGFAALQRLLPFSATFWLMMTALLG